MKKIFSLLILSLFVISTIVSVSAATIPLTIVNGKIYHAGDINDTIAGASVNVNCNGYSRNTTSSSLGSYGVTFCQNECTEGNLVTVYATSGGLYGSNSGVVENGVINWLNVAVINVPLVPEFGLVVGLLTVLSAMVMFFVVRKH